MNDRITLSDNLMSATIKLAEGNPGAAVALMEIIRDTTTDPDNVMGGFGTLCSLDSLGIYGTDIYVLYSDICGKNVVNLLTIMRGHQLGFLRSSVLKDACSRQDYSGKDMIDIADLYIKVCDYLPNFDKANRTNNK